MVTYSPAARSGRPRACTQRALPSYSTSACPSATRSTSHGTATHIRSVLSFCTGVPRAPSAPVNGRELTLYYTLNMARMRLPSLRVPGTRRLCDKDTLKRCSGRRHFRTLRVNRIFGVRVDRCRVPRGRMPDGAAGLCLAVLVAARFLALALLHFLALARAGMVRGAGPFVLLIHSYASCYACPVAGLRRNQPYQAHMERSRI